MTLLEEIKKTFNLVTLILTIGSIIMSVYFYYNGVKVKNISFEITEPPSLIFDSQNSSSTIKLIVNDTIPIRQNVYLFTGKLWNDGDLPISQSDIRKDLVLHFKGAISILDYKIVKQTENSIANFKLTNESKNSLKIHWDYFDPGYGFIYQVIYVGNEDAKFELSGKILDIPKFERMKDKTNLKISISIGYAIFISTLLIIIVILRRLYVRRTHKFFAVFYSLLLLCYVVMAYYVFINFIFGNSSPI